MYPYEGMFLVDPVLHAADPTSVENGITGLLEKHGAKITKHEVWDERKLAYEIKGHKRGVYILAYFEMPGDNVDALRRECRITEILLRQLIIRIEGDIPTHLEKSAKYYDKMREDQESRRMDRPFRREDQMGPEGFEGSSALD
jgi:small subunit ribosomal protein S6